MRMYYGVSTGDTGDYGIGNIVRGTLIHKEDMDVLTLDGEPVYNIWYIENNEIVYVEV